MPIRPKHVLGTQASAVPRPFVGRAEFITRFEQALGARVPKPVLVFYGVGGIGKSSLRRQLSGLTEARPDTVSAVLDFETANFRSAETALFLLRKTLGQKYKVRFPTFDIAYALYWRKAHPGADLSKEEPWLLGTGNQVAEIVGQLGAVSLVALVPKLAIIMARGGRSLQEWWHRRGSQEMSRLPELEPAEIAARLPGFWTADFGEHLEQHGSSSVILIDSYQAIWGDARTEASLVDRDAWVRQWIDRLPETLMIVFGRERLRWAEFEPEWNQRLSQHKMPGLTEEEIEQFLSAGGVADPAVREVISEASIGVPAFLNLALDTCQDIHERQGREPTPADFETTPREMFSRFLGHLPPNEIEALKVLSVPRYWSPTLAEQLMIDFRTGFAVGALSELAQLPFVNPGPLPETWTLNRLVRACLFDHIPADFRTRLHRHLFDLFAQRLEQAQGSPVSDEHWQLLTDASYHAQHALKSGDFVDWVLAATVRFAADSTRGFLVPLYQQVINVIEARPESQPESLDELRQRLSQLLGGTV